VLLNFLTQKILRDAVIAPGEVGEILHTCAAFDFAADTVFIRILDACGLENQRIKLDFFIAVEWATRFVDEIGDDAAAGGGKHCGKAQNFEGNSGLARRSFGGQFIGTQ
jgi:hypothetical protein